MAVSESSVYSTWENLPETAKAVVVSVIANIITQGAIFSDSNSNTLSLSTQEIQLVVALAGIILVVDGVHKSRIQGIHRRINQIIDLVEEIQSRVGNIVRPDGGGVINRRSSLSGLFGGALLGTALGVSFPIYIPLVTGFIGALIGNRIVRIAGLQAYEVSVEGLSEETEVEPESEDDGDDISDIGEQYLSRPDNISLQIQSLIESALVSAQRENFEVARQELFESLDLAREVGSETAQAPIWELLGDIHLMSDDLESAQEYFQNSLQIYQSTGDVEREIPLLLKMARVAREQDQLEDAEGLLRRAQSLMERTNE